MHALAMADAAERHGLTTHQHLRGRGWSPRQIDHAVRTGTLVPLHHGVYRFAAAPVTHRQRLLAAVLGAGPGAAVSHRSAAGLEGLWSPPPDLVEITVARRTSPDLDGVTTHRLADLTPRWIVTVQGIPTTCPARTLVDVGAVVPLGAVATMLDRAIGRRLCTLAEAERARRAVARKGSRGAGVLRTLLEERLDGPLVDGPLHTRLLALIRHHELPDPVVEHTILDDTGGFVARVDCAYPELRYAIELDGFEHHTGRAAFQHDRTRQNALIDLDWTVHRFTHDDVWRRSTAVVRQIRATIVRLTARARRPSTLLGTLDHT